MQNKTGEKKMEWNKYQAIRKYKKLGHQYKVTIEYSKGIPSIGINSSVNKIIWVSKYPSLKPRKFWPIASWSTKI